jgi:hypothetical protein
LKVSMMGGVTPLASSDDKVEGDLRALPHLRVDQLRARQRELEDAQLKLELERVEL